MKIAFIADSICTSGLGHLNRCLALAESFNRNYNISINNFQNYVKNNSERCRYFKNKKNK